jgi:hypothetical protein
VVEAVVEVGVKRVVEVEGEEEEGVAIRKTQEVGVEVVHVELGHVDQAGLVVAEVRHMHLCVVSFHLSLDRRIISEISCKDFWPQSYSIKVISITVSQNFTSSSTRFCPASLASIHVRAGERG